MLDRFSQGLPDVQDKEPVAECSHCGAGLCAGDMAYQDGGDFCCSANCMVELMGMFMVEVLK